MITASGALFFCTTTRRYLFLLRDNHRHKNTWCWPGGKLEAGETPIQGARREIREEMGVEPHYQKAIPLEVFTSADGNFVYHTWVFVVGAEFIPNLNHEHRGYCWTSLDGWPRPLHPGLFNTLSEDSIKEKLKVIESTF